MVRTYRNEISDVNEQLYSCKAELEYAKMTVLRSDGDDFLQSVELKGKIEEYERTVGLMKEQIKEMRGQRGINNEVDKETLELSAVAKMYSTDSDDSDNDEETEDFKSFTLREDTMTSHLADIDATITAKEELVTQLVGSRRKFEAMRGFYESKLVEMGKKLSEDEKEKEVRRGMNSFVVVVVVVRGRVSPNLSSLVAGAQEGNREDQQGGQGREPQDPTEAAHGEGAPNLAPPQPEEGAPEPHPGRGS